MIPVNLADGISFHVDVSECLKYEDFKGYIGKTFLLYALSLL